MSSSSCQLAPTQLVGRGLSPRRVMPLPLAAGLLERAGPARMRRWRAIRRAQSKLSMSGRAPTSRGSVSTAAGKLGLVHADVHEACCAVLGLTTMLCAGHAARYQFRTTPRCGRTFEE